jgi:hypothetical protein
MPSDHGKVCNPSGNLRRKTSRRPYFHPLNADRPLGSSRNCVGCQEWVFDLEISQVCTWEIPLRHTHSIAGPDDILTDLLPATVVLIHPHYVPFVCDGGHNLVP